VQPAALRQRHGRCPPTGWSFLAIAAAAGLLSACAGYRLGPTGGQTARAQSIRVNYFKNQTLEPRLAEPFTQALRRQLQQDGTYRLATGTDADLVVDGVLLEYVRRPMAYQPDDLISVREYELTIRVRVIARERLSGRVLLEKDIGGRTAVSVGDDLASTERQAAPLLANDFARNAVTALAEGAW
jgi:hypothetical protein